MDETKLLSCDAQPKQVKAKMKEFVDRSRRSNPSAIGLLLDAVSCVAARICRGINMKRFSCIKPTPATDGAGNGISTNDLRKKIRGLNSMESITLFTDKAAFDEQFSDFLGRDFFCMEGSTLEDFVQFLEEHPDAIAKPRYGKGGHLLERIALPEGVDERKNLFDRLVHEEKLVEEMIPQHRTLSEVYGRAVNTIRITTVLTKAGPLLLAPVIRFGRGESVTDNFDSGGVCCMVYYFTGVVQSPAMDKEQKQYPMHPDSGKRFDCVIVPYWHEVLDLVNEAALKAADTPCVGWDVAITPNGPVLVEGNVRPSFEWQCVDRRGWRKEFARAYALARRRC